MQKPGKNDALCPAEHSEAVELRTLQVEHRTKRQQMLHGTIRVLICAFALPADGLKAILVSHLSSWL